jgi:hypothetical protein
MGRRQNPHRSCAWIACPSVRVTASITFVRSGDGPKRMWAHMHRLDRFLLRTGKQTGIGVGVSMRMCLLELCSVALDWLKLPKPRRRSGELERTVEHFIERSRSPAACPTSQQDGRYRWCPQGSVEKTLIMRAPDSPEGILAQTRVPAMHPGQINLRAYGTKETRPRVTQPSARRFPIAPHFSCSRVPRGHARLI